VICDPGGTYTQLIGFLDRQAVEYRLIDHAPELEYFRDLVHKAGGGNYQTLINDALLEHAHRRSTLDVVRQVVREKLAPYANVRRADRALRRTRFARR